jgi:hypothetical protein
VARLWWRPGAADQAVSITAYTSVLRRHVAEGTLVLPFNPPITLPFPFDIGLAISGVRWERVVADGWVFETARVTLFFDAVRAPTSRLHFGLGPTLAHAMRGGLGRELTHELMPLTGLQALMALESEDGRWALEASAVAGWTFVPGGQTGTFRARAELTGRRVVLAVNDQPLYFTVRATAAYGDFGASARHELGVTAGLSLQLFAGR